MTKFEPKIIINNNDNTTYNNPYHQGMPIAQIHLTSSCHTSQLAITLGKFSRWHPLSAQS